jgi:hypothetical protein
MSLLNKSEVKKYTRDALLHFRPHLAEKMTRISSDWYIALDQIVVENVRKWVMSATSAGKTLYPPTKESK